MRLDQGQLDLLIPMRVEVGHLGQLTRAALAVGREQVDHLVDLLRWQQGALRAACFVSANTCEVSVATCPCSSAIRASRTPSSPSFRATSASSSAIRSSRQSAATANSSPIRERMERAKKKMERYGSLTDPAPIRGQSRYAAFSVSYSRFFFSSMNFISNSLGLT